MRWLAETTIDADFPPCASPVVEQASLSRTDRELWSRFSSKRNLRICDSTPESPDGFWNLAALIDESQRSQFDVLVECTRERVELPQTFACLALTGTGFHGNRERSWNALPGNLHFSSFCRANLHAADCGPALSMLPTVAVTDALSSLSGKATPTPWIKWVNDVYFDDSKVSGSLVFTELQGDRIESFVLGIGLNVATVPDLANESGFGSATSLAEHGFDVTFARVFHELLHALAKRIPQLDSSSGRAQLCRDYRRRLGGIGRDAVLYPPGCENHEGTQPLASGRLIDVHPDLSIELEGHSERFRNGRLRLSSR